MPGDGCDVEGCTEEARRSVSTKHAMRCLKGIPEHRRRVHLCKQHYKVVKKEMKEKRDLERLGWT